MSGAIRLLPLYPFVAILCCNAHCLIFAGDTLKYSGDFFYVFSTVYHSTELFHQPTLMHSFLYSLTICLLHYYP